MSLFRVSRIQSKNLEGYLYKKKHRIKMDTYRFDDFNINSSFDQDQVRTITVNSPDIVQVKL
jgi:hypothetical protein